MKIQASIFVLSLAALAGCSHDKKADSPADSAKSPDSTHQAVAAAVAENQGGQIALSDEVQRLCPGVTPPQFSYDSASLQQSWHRTLQGLAGCMKTGGLAGKRLLLTGHTDPRGDDDYNLALGGRRAEAVKRAVTSFGVGGDRLDTTSRGETDATGNDDGGWAHDRRVDVDLAQTGKVSAN